ncbi:hypothetical protein J8J04_00310 ['Fragaria x ananassa' phyllody phytoplasma]|uniref:Effector n=1 Tax='Fragaria x ananassa' phyllody phytoplasma TaxID=2358428 RepID=A0ABS5K2R3_9MOLU|nr:hypothetical protein ['Fragaria x ananassa' phyllody phytoplasma]MBS2126166.1 hypothetical protein ['Fragaria x ananassa' phyllody phytoplasma]
MKKEYKNFFKINFKLFFILIIALLLINNNIFANKNKNDNPSQKINLIPQQLFHEMNPIITPFSDEVFISIPMPSFFVNKLNILLYPHNNEEGVFENRKFVFCHNERNKLKSIKEYINNINDNKDDYKFDYSFVYKYNSDEQIKVATIDSKSMNFEFESFYNKDQKLININAKFLGDICMRYVPTYELNKNNELLLDNVHIYDQDNTLNCLYEYIYDGPTKKLLFIIYIKPSNNSSEKSKKIIYHNIYNTKGEINKIEKYINNSIVEIMHQN